MRRNPPDLANPLGVGSGAHAGAARVPASVRWLRPQDRLALVHVPDLAMDLVGHSDGAEPSPGQLLTMTVVHVDPDEGSLKLRFQ